MIFIYFLILSSSLAVTWYLWVLDIFFTLFRRHEKNEWIRNDDECEKSQSTTGWIRLVMKFVSNWIEEILSNRGNFFENCKELIACDSSCQCKRQQSIFSKHFTTIAIQHQLNQIVNSAGEHLSFFFGSCEKQSQFSSLSWLQKVRNSFNFIWNHRMVVQHHSSQLQLYVTFTT